MMECPICGNKRGCDCSETPEGKQYYLESRVEELEKQLIGGRPGKYSKRWYVLDVIHSRLKDLEEENKRLRTEMDLIKRALGMGVFNKGTGPVYECTYRQSGIRLTPEEAEILK